VIYQPVQTPYYLTLLRDLISEHLEETQSRFAERILTEWEVEQSAFWQIVPREMLNRLEHPILLERVAV
jgi:glutamate synthase (NADPH/NADH) large chain